MQTHRIATTIASILSLAAAKADLYMGLGADQRHYQHGALKLRFDQGELNLLLRDGLVILDGACVVDPQLFFFPPSTMPPCPLGATGFVAQGDIDRDGIRDDNQYWSVLTVIPALLVEPSRQELVQLFSAPPTELPRPLENFRDDSLVTFYDISTPQVRQYDQTRYEFVRRYGSVRQVVTALATGGITSLDGGTIVVRVTGADFPEDVVVTANATFSQTAAEWAVSVRGALAANPALSALYSVGGNGNAIVLTERVADGNDPTLSVSLDAATTAGGPTLSSVNSVTGSVVGAPAAAHEQMSNEIKPGQYLFTFPRLGAPELNPVGIPVNVLPYIEPYGAGRDGRSGFRFTSGSWNNGVYQIDPRLIARIRWQGNNRAVIRPGDQIYFSILNDAEDFLTFPPTVPQNPVLLQSPTAQSYTLPPFFYEVGDTGVINLRFQRFLPSSGVSYDVSQREFRARTQMVDTYFGYAQVTFPLGTNRRALSPQGNVDGDSMTNIEEFAYQFPTNEDINASAKEQFEPDISPFFDFVEEFNRVVTPQVPDPIVESDLQPEGPAAPFLDDEDHLVFEVPYRPRTGNTLRYSFVEFFTNKRGQKKARKIRNLARDWDVTIREEPYVDEEGNPLINATIEVKIVNAITGDVVAIQTRPGTTPVELNRQFLVLRSREPVDPANPLPDLGVSLGAVRTN